MCSDLWGENFPWKMCAAFPLLALAVILPCPNYNINQLGGKKRKKKMYNDCTHLESRGDWSGSRVLSSTLSTPHLCQLSYAPPGPTCGFQKEANGEERLWRATLPPVLTEHAPQRPPGLRTSHSRELQTHSPTGRKRAIPAAPGWSREQRPSCFYKSMCVATSKHVRRTSVQGTVLFSWRNVPLPTSRKSPREVHSWLWTHQRKTQPCNSEAKPTQPPVALGPSTWKPLDLLGVGLSSVAWPCSPHLSRGLTCLLLCYSDKLQPLWFNRSQSWDRMPFRFLCVAFTRRSFCNLIASF